MSFFHDLRCEVWKLHYDIIGKMLNDKELKLSVSEHERAIKATKLLIEVDTLLMNDSSYKELIKNKNGE